MSNNLIHKRKVFDCFIFDNKTKFSLLKWRLEYLYCHVDGFFIIVPCFVNFGEINLEILDKCNDFAFQCCKVCIYKLNIDLKEMSDLELIYNYFNNFSFFENKINNGDVCLLSFLNEIPNYDVIKWYLDNKITETKVLRQKNFNDYVNFTHNKSTDILGTIITTHNKPFNAFDIWKDKTKHDIITEGGWYFLNNE